MKNKTEKRSDGRNLLIETVYQKVEQLQSDPGFPYLRIRALISESDKINRNGRVYPASVWERNVKSVNENIDTRPGAAYHPSGETEIPDVAIRWERWWIEGNKVFGDGYIVPTHVGQDLRACIEAGVTVGISTRGYGSVEDGDWQGEKAEIIQEDYECDTADSVIRPSSPNAKIVTYEEEERMKSITVEDISAHFAENEDDFTAFLDTIYEAKWTTAYKNSLPDSSFALVHTPVKNKAKDRALPYKDGDGKVDADHVRNALARLPLVKGFSDEEKAAAKSKLQRALKSIDGKSGDEEDKTMTNPPFNEAKTHSHMHNHEADSSGYDRTYAHEHDHMHGDEEHDSAEAHRHGHKDTAMESHAHTKVEVVQIAIANLNKLVQEANLTPDEVSQIKTHVKSIDDHNDAVMKLLGVEDIDPSDEDEQAKNKSEPVTEAKKAAPHVKNAISALASAVNAKVDDGDYYDAGQLAHMANYVSMMNDDDYGEDWKRALSGITKLGEERNRFKSDAATKTAELTTINAEHEKNHSELIESKNRILTIDKLIEACKGTTFSWPTFLKMYKENISESEVEEKVISTAKIVESELNTKKEPTGVPLVEEKHEENLTPEEIQLRRAEDLYFRMMGR